MKEIQMTLPGGPELRSSVLEAAELDHRSIKCSVSAAERQRREDAVNFARASVGLEGFKPSTKEEAHAQLFINGEIELVEFVKVNEIESALGPVRK
ncbi:antitoxin VbhA family protein [Collimonas antrihumi]|uniref:antitoxin VbhA family protein n=1 Tax=Collimonas antrihumi TaxID=1940615 RepID=UPI001FEAC37E|nr:antitoxin VbhA family protein [Collimonas antrihumi]